MSRSSQIHPLNDTDLVRTKSGDSSDLAASIATQRQLRATALTGEMSGFNATPGTELIHLRIIIPLPFSEMINSWVQGFYPSIVRPNTIVDFGFLDPAAPLTSITSDYAQTIQAPFIIKAIQKAEMDGVHGCLVNIASVDTLARGWNHALARGSTFLSSSTSLYLSPITLHVSVSFDTGMDVSKHVVNIPVVGALQSAIGIAQSVMGNKFSILSISPNEGPVDYRLMKEYHHLHRLASVRPINIPVLNLSSHFEQLVSEAVKQSKLAIHEDGADTIILGCTGMIGLAPRLQTLLGDEVPVIDGSTIGLYTLEDMVRLNLRQSKRWFDRPDQLIPISIEEANRYPVVPLKNYPPAAVIDGTRMGARSDLSSLPGCSSSSRLQLQISDSSPSILNSLSPSPDPYASIISSFPSPTPSPAFSDASSTASPTSTTRRRCDVCEVDFWKRKLFEAHMNSVKHQKAVKEAAEELVACIEYDQLPLPTPAIDTDGTLGNAHARAVALMNVPLSNATEGEDTNNITLPAMTVPPHSVGLDSSPLLWLNKFPSSPAPRYVLMGMSLNNSFYTRRTVFLQAKFALLHFHRVYFFIPSTPHIVNFRAAGYTDEHALKAINKGVRRYYRWVKAAVKHVTQGSQELVQSTTTMSLAHLPSDVRCVWVRWDEDVADHHTFLKYQHVHNGAYRSDPQFQTDIISCVKEIGTINSPGQKLEPTKIDIAAQYLLDELAFMAALPMILSVPVERLTQMYHTRWILALRFFDSGYYSNLTTSKDEYTKMGFLIVQGADVEQSPDGQSSPTAGIV